MITPADIGYVAERYGLAVGECPSLTVAARGAMGRIWCLASESGPRYAVKELLWGGAEPEVRNEVAFRDAAATRAGIVAPASHRTEGGDYLCELPGGRGLVRVFDWVDGRPVTPDQAAAEWLGHTLAGLHRLALPVGDAEPNPWYWQCPQETDWHDLARAATGAPWALALLQARPRLTALSAGVVPDVGPQWIWCHHDLTPSNVLGGPGLPFTLVDWENAGPGTPERELAAALVAWTGPDQRLLARMLAAYRGSGGPVETLSPAAFSMPTATQVNYVYVQARAALDQELTPDDRHHAGQECAAALASLPGPTEFDTIRRAANDILRRTVVP